MQAIKCKKQARASERASGGGCARTRTRATNYQLGKYDSEVEQSRRRAEQEEEDEEEVS